MKHDALIEFTSRENEILQLLQEGASNKAIATQLNISVNTVKFHLQNVYRKLEVNNRMQVLAVCLREGSNERSALTK